jgi:hypothetical protein
MFPTVSKVILVDKLALFRRGDLCQPIFPLIDDRFPILFTWDAVVFARNDELVQMAVGPSHCDLNNFMHIK